MYAVLIKTLSFGDGCTNGGIACLTDLVDRAVWFFVGALAIYFYVSLVINLAQAQVSVSLGDSSGYNHAIQQTLSLLVLLAVAGAVAGGSTRLVAGLDALVTGGQNPDAVLGFWKSVAQAIITVVLSASVIFMVVSAVYNGFLMQLGQVVGNSGEVSQRIMLLIGVIISGVVTLMSVTIAGMIIEAVF